MAKWAEQHGFEIRVGTEVVRGFDLNNLFAEMEYLTESNKEAETTAEAL